MPDSRLICTSITERDKRGLEIRVECTVYRDYPAVEWITMRSRTAPF